jgi:hypothetical protein
MYRRYRCAVRVPIWEGRYVSPFENDAESKPDNQGSSGSEAGSRWIDLPSILDDIIWGVD